MSALPTLVKPSAGFDYSTLALGTVLVTRNGTRFVKDGRKCPVARGDLPNRPVFGSTVDGGSWQNWQRDGTLGRGQHTLDLVGFENAIPVPNMPYIASCSVKVDSLCAADFNAVGTITAGTINAPWNTSMNAINVTQQTLVNGAPITGYSDAQLYGLIASQEQHIESLDKIQNKPIRLVNEIQKMQAGIQALVDELNSRDAATGVAAPVKAPRKNGKTATAVVA